MRKPDPITDAEMIGHAAGGRARDPHGLVDHVESVPITLRRYDESGNVVLERSAIVDFSATVREDVSPS